MLWLSLFYKVLWFKVFMVEFFCFMAIFVSVLWLSFFSFMDDFLLGVSWLRGGLAERAMK